MRLRREVLDNGLRILVAPVRDTRTVTVLVFVEAGSKYETKKTNGVSHFLEHLCFKGTTQYPTPSELSYAFDALGAENNAFTAEEYTGYYAKVDVRHFDTIVDLVADIYIDAKLDPDEIDRERGVVIEEINLYNDKPTWHAEDLITDLLYGAQPAGREVLGTKENIRRFSREDIIQYRQAHYVASGTTVVVVGNVKSPDVIRKVQRAFARISSGRKEHKKPVQEKQKHPVVGVRYRKTDQAHMILGIRTVPYAHKDVPALTLLATLLGGGMSSRFFTRLRDELGLCYYVSANNRLFTDHGYLAIRAGVAKTRVDEAVREILRICAQHKDTLVSARELQKAKNYYIGNMHLSFEATDALAWSLGTQELLGTEVRIPTARAKQIRAVRPEDIRRTARRIFQDKNLNLAVVGPYKKDTGFKRVLHV